MRKIKNKLSLLFFFYISILLTGVAFSAVAPSINPVDKYTVPSGAPARIAAGIEGKIYVTDSMNGIVSVFSNNGLLLNEFKIDGSPLGISADEAGRIYISDTKNNNAGVYDPEGNLLFMLGAGNGEFLLPNDIAVSNTGKIYVTDSKAGMVKMYSAIDGLSIGTFGSGLLKLPTGIAVDDEAGEVLVVDYKNLYIRIYTLTGTLKMSIKGNSGGGMLGGSNRILRPLGIAFDSTRIYVIDAYHSVAVVYDRANGSFLSYVGNYGEGPVEFKTPTDAVIDKDGKMFVANTNNYRIEALGIDIYKSIKISHDKLDFSAYTRGPSVTQTVDLSSAVTDTAWDATVSEQWISLSANSGTTPSSVAVTVNPAEVLPGNYNCEVKFKTASGIVSLLKLNVEVKMPVLLIAPSEFIFTYQRNSADLPSGSLLIGSVGAELPWTGNTTAEWLTLGIAAGTTPSSPVVSINDAINKLDPGTYTAYVGIDAGVNVSGSPASIGVTVNLIEAGDIKVTTNLDEASFTITGPQNFSGSGKSWTEANVKNGTYFISFDHVSGYIRPYGRSFTVVSGKAVEVNAEYLKKKEITHIVAGAGGIIGGELSVLNLAGEKVLSIVPFAPAKNPDKNSIKNVRVAVGDLDGKGLDKIVVTDNIGKLKIYSFEGTELASLSLSKSYRNADIAVGDIDNDGKADILVAVTNSKIIGKELNRVIKIFNYSDGQIQEKPVLFTENILGEFSIALGDIDGDGIIEAILADLHNVRAFKINTAERTFTQIWSVPSGSRYLPRLAAGDIDDDGVDEIALSITQAISKTEEKPAIRVLEGDGKEYGIKIDAFGDLGYFKTSTVCLGDIDGDGIDEIAAGAGPDSRNGALIRLFESDGIFMNTTIKAMDSTYGVNISLGRFAY